MSNDDSYVSLVARIRRKLRQELARADGIPAMFLPENQPASVELERRVAALKELLFAKRTEPRLKSDVVSIGLDRTVEDPVSVPELAEARRRVVERLRGKAGGADRD